MDPTSNKRRALPAQQADDVSALPAELWTSIAANLPDPANRRALRSTSILTHSATAQQAVANHTIREAGHNVPHLTQPQVRGEPDATWQEMDMRPFERGAFPAATPMYPRDFVQPAMGFWDGWTGNETKPAAPLEPVLTPLAPATWLRLRLQDSSFVRTANGPGAPVRERFERKVLLFLRPVDRARFVPVTITGTNMPVPLRGVAILAHRVFERMRDYTAVYWRGPGAVVPKDGDRAFSSSEPPRWYLVLQQATGDSYSNSDTSRASMLRYTTHNAVEMEAYRVFLWALPAGVGAERGGWAPSVNVHFSSLADVFGPAPALDAGRDRVTEAYKRIGDYLRSARQNDADQVLGISPTAEPMVMNGSDGSPRIELFPGLLWPKADVLAAYRKVWPGFSGGKAPPADIHKRFAKFYSAHISAWQFGGGHTAWYPYCRLGSVVAVAALPKNVP